MKNGNVRFVLGGLMVGAVNGLLGGGGGMIAVPLLQMSGLPPKNAHATAIAVILPAAAVSGLCYLLNGLAPFFILLPVAAGVFTGGLLGAKLLGALPVRVTGALFGALMLLAGGRMLF